MPKARTRDKHMTPTPSGTLCHIRIHGELHRQHFRKGTPKDVMRAWLLATESRFRRAGVRKTGKFADDARAYLESVKAMPSYSDRAQHIEEWIEVFGDRPRSAIGPDEIAAQLHRWRTETRTIVHTRRATQKPAKTSQRVLSASAVNKRRTALMHLFSVLDGKAAQNPVKDVPKFREPDPRPRGERLATIRALFAAMGDTPNRARAQVIAYTGIPHAQLKRLTASDVDFDAARAFVEGRRKGAGTQARAVPLIPAAVEAFRALHRHEAWGNFSNSSLRKAIRTACKKAQVPVITTYDLRHFFGTQVYRTSGDIRATQALLGLSSPALANRYSLAAVDPRAIAALKQFEESE